MAIQDQKTGSLDSIGMNLVDGKYVNTGFNVLSTMQLYHGQVRNQKNIKKFIGYKNTLAELYTLNINENIQNLL